ncbi:hypothetical protein EJV47_19230 [Hymenobacter gummosus]|uniref:DUF1795 domain-containing protein n=1 Tax=Hymenobacter gummosus TaxID=1776032 RepID=A0A3S0H356_9BACT|nr:hypothetical protein [Hymenobacter gummosus]RTQ47550.1 hypothetical protein EJV47_19230 [Hymenobacter gummosus]
MKALLFVIGLLLTSLAAPAQDGGVTFRVDEQLNLWLPEQPQELNVAQTLKDRNSASKNEPMAQVTRAFRLEDGVATYIIIRIPLAEPPPLPASFAERKAYYTDRTIPLLMTQAKGEVLTQSVEQLAGADVITLKFQALNAAGQPSVKYLRTFTLGRIVYQLYFVPRDGRGDDSQQLRNWFFSFKRPTPVAKP